MAGGTQLLVELLLLRQITQRIFSLQASFFCALEYTQTKQFCNFSTLQFFTMKHIFQDCNILVFNKTDLLADDQRRYQQMMVTLYETIGYECRQISAETGDGVEALRPLLTGKITLLSGNSGVGKSTLINRLVPGANLRTAEISEAHLAGQHTTTFSEMISLPPSPSEGGGADALVGRDNSQSDYSPLSQGGAGGGSYLIDTPGIKGFGTFDMEREELTSYFKEIFEFSKQCRFSDCSHTHEPGCAVLKAVEDHYIAQSRYQSYLSMLDDKDENKYREAY